MVEAFEDPGERFVVAVQWHAEAIVWRPEQTALFGAFAAACSTMRGPRIARAA